MADRAEIKKAIYGWVRDDLSPDDGVVLSPDHLDRLTDKIAAIPSDSLVERLARLRSATKAPLPVNFSICADVQPGLVVLVADGRVSYAGPIKDMPNDHGKLQLLNEQDFTSLIRRLQEKTSQP